MRGREDHSFQGGAGRRLFTMRTRVLPRQLKKADGAVAGLAVPVLPFLEGGDGNGLFPAVGHGKMKAPACP